MSGPGAGFEYPPQEVTWLKRDVLLFANTIGCTADELHFLYVRPLHDDPSQILMVTGTPPELFSLSNIPNHPA
jgi:hypothetical protein